MKTSEETEEIIKGNKLLAKYNKVDISEYADIEFYYNKNLLYNLDWNLLMPTITKVKREIKKKGWFDNILNDINKFLLEGDKEECFNSTICLIEQLNENK